MKQIQKGFTLIELMIVVAIIGILAAVAIPQYQDYVTRTRWSNVVTEFGAIRTAVSECIQRNAGDPTVCETAVQLGIDPLPTTIGSPPGRADLTGPATTAGADGLGGTSTWTLTAPTTADGGGLSAGCVVVAVAIVGPGRVTWDYGTTAASPAACTRGRTGFARS